MKRIACLLLAAVTAAPLTAAEPDLSITIYNQNLALVRELRTLPLVQGVQVFSFDGVAAAIDPTSVRFSAQEVSVLEQNFEFDLVGREALMKRYLGEVIDVQMENETVRGRLLSVQGAVIVEDRDGEVRLIDSSAIQSIRFPELPEGLIIKPTLRWLLNSKRQGDVSSELNYLTRDIGWEASYVAVVDEEDRGLELSGWVQITNRSGANYLDALLKLMAGDVRVLQPAAFKGGDMMRTLAMDGMAEGGFEEKSFFEYHLYTLPRRVTILDNQVKQIRLIEPAKAAVKKRYGFEGWRGSDKVQVSLEFINSKENELGIPLPAGKVRLYKADSDGSLQFIGEDRIQHTPKDEKVTLQAGNAFDVVAEKSRTDFWRMSGSTREETNSVEVRNRKDEAVQVDVRDRFGGDWSILEESHKGVKKDAWINEWTLTIPANQTMTLTYRVRIN